MKRMYRMLVLIIVLMTVCLIVCACTQAHNEKNDNEKEQTQASTGDEVMIDFSDFSKLKMVCLGDSLTAGQGIETPYSAFVKEELGFKEVYNYGIGWSTVANGGTCDCHPNNYEGGHNPFVYRYSLMNQGDIIAVCGGANDHGLNVPIGTIDDTAETTFYGALNRLITGLKKCNPGAYIFFMTPFNYDTVNDNGIHLSGYVEAIKKVCEKHDIDCFDCYTEVPINVGVDTIDGTHPTQDYVQNVWAPKIAQFIRENVG